MSFREFASCLTLLCAAVLSGVAAPQQTPEIPLVPGLKITFAVHVPDGGPAASGIAQGDYEMVVEVSSVSESSIGLTTRIEAQDAAGRPLDLDIRRRVSRQDLEAARLQILGFHTSDPPEIGGSTALGPSLAILRDLRTQGRADFSVQNFRHLSRSTGALTREADSPVTFPVLVNGVRVELPAIRATGQLKYSGGVRPWEYYLLDHPQHPLTLHFAHGALGAGIPFKPETARDIVRIDFPRQPRLEAGLRDACRVEVPGIYFDFNRATLNPLSRSALTEIAAVLKREAGWRITIEGHTDNVGTDAYNKDLSARRAAAVMGALVRDFGIDAGRLTTAGFGESRPRETNETIAGRARNRRVELVRDCGGREGRRSNADLISIGEESPWNGRVPVSIS
jgi:outer membrane protein OmpA-like peptidoglycan-associated protein